MAWSRRFRRNTSLQRHNKQSKFAAKDILHLSKRMKKHAKCQLWLWSRRQKIGIFRPGKTKRQMLHIFSCSRTQVPFRSKRNKLKPKAFEPSYATVPSLSNRVEEEKLEMCKINSGDCEPVSIAADVSVFHNNLDGAVVDLTTFSEKAHSEDLIVHVDLTKENEGENAGVEISTENECTRQKMSENIREYLFGFHQKYGSFIPLEKKDILKYVMKKLNKDVDDCQIMILEVIIEEMAKIISSMPHFEVKYKKHRLTLDDLSTLASESWLNDQVINMYGELILDSADSNIYFLNSFFHKQLMSKGYEGVKRWTKQVNLFSKRLLLVPVHIEVHWCLVTADFVIKTVCLYDSQSLGLQKVAKNIIKYLSKEAKEKKQPAFEKGWTLSVKEDIPQQCNENDCGVFVLEYCRRLALCQPLQFLQRDIPAIRKRMYKELCDHSLH